MGATQHTVGTQNVRSYAILQILLGNIGRAGGGINALRGESNVQGSTDFGLLYDILPGYLKAPRSADANLADYLTRYTPKTSDPEHSLNYLSNTPKFMVSLLKAYWGDKAQKENDFCYHYLPKVGGDYSHISMFEAMYAGRIKGLILMGQNPAVGGPNARMERRALERLDWMVAVDLWETETAAFWKGPEAGAEAIKTEVFLLPAASSVEKEGSITNSGRWMQWRYKAVEPPGDAKSDLWIIDQIYQRVRNLYAKEGGVHPEPILHLAWNYGHGEEPDVSLVAREINGRDLATGKQLASFAGLKDDGTTLSGSWIYSGSYTEAGNMAARRGKDDSTGLAMYHNWAWSWPVNRRVIYNRASCDAAGNPYDPSRPVLRWTGTEWVGDVPDYGATTPPARGVGAFIMRPEGRACLFGPGMAEGPFPEHYEPVESPVDNTFSSVQNNPVIVRWDTPGVDQLGTVDKYPIIATTYRLTEHWQTGPMTRNLPWLAELAPTMFVEMGRDLAVAKGIGNGDRVRIRSARGEITAVALVTDRIRSLQVNGRTCHQIGLPWHWGYTGLVTGDSANCLTPHVGDANTMMPEYKAFLCDVERVGQSVPSSTSRGGI
jgi:formate dehydrogenase major subunit